jgi:hypothetical protein
VTHQIAASPRFFAYAPSFHGGVFVAAGDLNGDGKDDIITGAGRGGGGQVKVFDAATLQAIDSFFAYGPSFPNDVRVAAGDVNGDGIADIITGAGNAAQQVRTFDGISLAALDSFFALDPRTSTGTFVAAAGSRRPSGGGSVASASGRRGAPFFESLLSPSAQAPCDFVILAVRCGDASKDRTRPLYCALQGPARCSTAPQNCT